MAQLAKLSRPRLVRVFRRQRLFRRLDSATVRPVVWVEGPPGAGKTTLVGSWIQARRLSALWYSIDEGDSDPASFFHDLALAAKDATKPAKALPVLAHEYLGGLEGFARRYAREMWSGVKPPFVIVLDNLQILQDGAPTLLAIAAALDEIPRGGNAIILSREGPPAALARLQLNGAIELISPSELALTLDESRGVAALRAADVTCGIEELHHRSNGWAAGLVLLVARANHGRSKLADPGTNQALFNYFAGEVLEQCDATTRKVLLETSPFVHISGAHAQAITGVSTAGEVLDELARRAYFTTRHEDAFRYHALFREFLLAQAERVLAPDRLRQVRIHGAQLFEQAGQVEAAVELLRDAGNNDEVARVVLEYAPALMASGRAGRLSGWLRSLPDDFVEARPLLLFWRGLSTFPFDPRGAQLELERCFEILRGSDDAAALYTVWAAIVNTYLYLWSNLNPLDRWIDEWDSLRRSNPAFPSARIEARASFALLTALIFRQPQHPELPHWNERLRTLLQHGSEQEQATVIFATLCYLCWTGHHKDMSKVLLTAQPVLAPAQDLIAALTWRFARAMCSWFEYGEYARAAVEFDSALSLARRNGARVWLYQLTASAVHNACASGRLADARRHLLEVRQAYDPSRELEAAFYHYAESHLAVLSGDLGQAVQHAELSLDKARCSGAWFAELFAGVMLAVAACEAGDPQRARSALEDVRRIGARSGSVYADYLCSVTEARIANKLRRPIEAIAPLRHAMAVGAEHGMLGTLGPDVTPELCALALAHGIEVEHVRKLIRARGLLPPDSALDEERWPWRIRVWTLGQFRVEVVNAPLRSGRKVPRKPLELLKALVAFGRGGVPDERLTDELWPDAEADAGQHALETTLYRLRKLLGDDEAVTQSDHRVTLDWRQVWVDAWATERRLSRARAALESGEADADTLLTDARNALEGYAGPFLPEDENAPWSAPLRERLHASVLRCLEALAKFPGGRAFAASWRESRTVRDAALLREEAANSVDQLASTAHSRSATHRV